MTCLRDALPQSIPPRFLLLDRLDSCDETGATARRAFTHAPPWQGLEAMAQLAALHARWTSGFALHAFLLTVEECTWPNRARADGVRDNMSNSTSGATPGDTLHGTLRIGACMLAQSDRAATYATTITALPPPSGATSTSTPPCMAATLIIGRTAYDTRFNGDTLAARYREIFAWLTRTA